MSAVQMMEPRMDVGMDPAGLRSLEESLAAGGAPARPTAEQALEVAEGLLARSTAADRDPPAASPARSCASAPGPRATRWRTPA